MSRLSEFRFDPDSIHRLMLNELESTFNGELELMDPTNPFIFLMEASAVLGSEGMKQANVLHRLQYPALAQTMDELYPHMTDVDYLDRFGTPGSTTMTILLGKDEIYSKAVDTGAGGVRKVVIPRHTSVTVAGTTFTMQYPIEIRVMNHGGLQIVYDGSRPSPIEKLISNQVEWVIENYNGQRQEFINIKVPMKQYKITPIYESLNAATGFKKTYSFEDNFYYCRVFMSRNQRGWEEIKTTHSEQVYDVRTPTAVLRVDGNQLTVRLPQVYFNTGLANTELRVDIYTTKGPISMALNSFNTGDFVAKWIDLDQQDNGIYSAPLQSMTTMTVYGGQAVSGGRTGLSFEELRARVMSNSLGEKSLPVTPAQLGSVLNNLGFGALKYVDNVTNRIYVATRALPTPETGDSYTAVGSCMGTLMQTFDYLSRLETVMVGRDQLTLLPDTLYRNVNGKLEIVPDAERRALVQLAAQDPEEFSKQYNKVNYLYSPFHYVLDISNNRFTTRAYHFGTPEITKKAFVMENPTLGIGITTSLHELSKTEHGWKLRVMTNSGEGFKELANEDVIAQLSFTPTGEHDRAYLNGTFLGRHSDTNEFIFEFDLDTTWDIDPEHDLCLDSFKMYDNSYRAVYTALETTFDLCYVVVGSQRTGQRSSEIDSLLGHFLLPDQSVGLYQEQLTLQLGQSLEGLWTRGRSMASSEEYMVHEQDVYETYLENVYLRNEAGGAVITVVDGRPTFTLLHRAGDPVIDSTGFPKVKFAKGTPIYDEYGNPVPKEPRKILYATDLFVIDGVYYFATSSSDIAYRDSIPNTIVEWLTEVLDNIDEATREETGILFQPVGTLGETEVLTDKNRKLTMDAGQSFNVVLYVSKAVYRDFELRALMTDTVNKTLARLLDNRMLAIDSIISTLKAALGDDVLALILTGLGGEINHDVITMVDESARLCIRKKLMATGDRQLQVVDDLKVDFAIHQS